MYDFLKKAAETPAEESIKTPATMKDWFNAYPHQARAINRLLDNDGNLILAHEVGTGKTVSSILGVEKLREQGRAKNALVVVPAGLRENFARGGLDKFLKDPKYQIVGSAADKKRPNYVRYGEIAADKPYTIVSYSMFRRDPIGLMERSGSDTLVFDEFHRARSETSSVFKAAVTARKRANNFIGLTGSLVNNRPGEVASLLTISSGKRYLSPKDFRNQFTQVVGYEKGWGSGKKKVRVLKNKPSLVGLVDPRVDYVPSKALKGKTMPKKDTKFIDVPMSNEQYKMYQLALDKLGPVKEFITRKDPSVIVKDIDPALVFAQIAHARQISNSMAMAKNMPLEEAAEATPKVKKLLDDTMQHLKENPDGKVVVYSNLVRGGADVLAAGLAKRGLDPAIFVGKGTQIGKTKVTSQTRTQGVKDFKTGKKKVLVLTGAGAEGLNLPNTTAFYSLDGHFNPERILQAEARGRRLGGQAHRPLEKRVLDVRRYRNTAPARFPKHKRPQTADEWVYRVAKSKFMRNREFYDTIEKPHKYVRKYRDRLGKWRYEYPPKRKFAANRKFYKALTG